MELQHDLEIRKALLASQEKFAYFLMLTAGAAIAFVIQKYEADPNPWVNGIPLAAMGIWGLSFVLGSFGVLHLQLALRANLELIELFRMQEDQGFDASVAQKITIEKEKFDFESWYSSKCFKAQFWTVVGGAGIYITTITNEILLSIVKALVE